MQINWFQLVIWMHRLILSDFLFIFILVLLNTSVYVWGLSKFNLFSFEFTFIFILICIQCITIIGVIMFKYLH